MQTSMLYTIGTALDRAHQDGSAVELLVEGAWIAGRVLASDGQGVVLEDGSSQVVVRLDRIAVVRVQSHDQAVDPSSAARPMPGPPEPAQPPQPPQPLRVPSVA